MKFAGERRPLGREFSRHICDDNTQELCTYALSGMRSVIELWGQIGHANEPSGCGACKIGECKRVAA